jgi:hypothetical protein
MCRTCFFTSLYPEPTITVQQLSPNYKSCTEEEEETTNCVTEGEKKNYPEILYSGGERTWAWLSQVSNSASGAAASKQAHFWHCKEG